MDQKFLFSISNRDEQKIGPQLGISLISGHFWPKNWVGVGLGVANFQSKSCITYGVDTKKCKVTKTTKILIFRNLLPT